MDEASTVYHRMEWNDAYLAVPVGLFSDPTFPAPTHSVYEPPMHPWVVLSE